jgi:hypothetical protein
MESDEAEEAYLADRYTQGSASGGDGAGLRHLGSAHERTRFTWAQLLWAGTGMACDETGSEAHATATGDQQ